jgi:hypothetical protein
MVIDELEDRHLPPAASCHSVESICQHALGWGLDEPFVSASRFLSRLRHHDSVPGQRSWPPWPGYRRSKALPGQLCHDRERAVVEAEFLQLFPGTEQQINHGRGSHGRHRRWKRGPLLQRFHRPHLGGRCPDPVEPCPGDIVFPAERGYRAPGRIIGPRRNSMPNPDVRLGFTHEQQQTRSPSVHEVLRQSVYEVMRQNCPLSHETPQAFPALGTPSAATYLGAWSSRCALASSR